MGKVRGDQRGPVWYLTYFEDGRRYRPRIDADPTTTVYTSDANVAALVDAGAKRYSFTYDAAGRRTSSS